MAYSGKYQVQNIEKYKGDPRKITYRSNWEKFFMGYLDKNPSIKQWGSETVVIPYFSNADGKKRRYFMDFWFVTTEGQQFFIEVKPKKETVPPKAPAQMTTAAKKRFINEAYVFAVNQDKWKAASATADKMGITFRILTEDGLRKLGYKGI